MVKLMEAEKRAILYHNPLDSRHADIIIDYCESRRFFLNYYIDDVLYATCDSSLRKYADIYSQQTGAIYRFTDGLGRFKGGSPTKMILITDSENSDISRTRDFLYGYFSDMMGAMVNIARTNPEYLEFFNIETDKGVALAKVAKHYGVKREEIIAFGDGENDIPMLEYAGFSAAPSNARPAVKKSAGTVSVWSNNQSAVGKFLEGI
jgi:hydroxymethylpyrimidine pyrophosphatase-like HAD family hydrolase